MPKRIIQNVHIYRLDISKHSYAWGSVQKVPVEKQSVQIKCQDLKDNTTLTEVTFRQQLQKNLTAISDVRYIWYLWLQTTDNIKKVIKSVNCVVIFAVPLLFQWR